MRKISGLLNIKDNKESFYWLCFILIVIAYFSSLGVFDLRGEEPRRALIAMEMVKLDQYIIPHLHGQPYYNKPPLFNWILVGFYHIFGSWDEWVIRLPGILSLLITAVVNFYFIRRYLSAEIAIWSSLIFLTLGEILFYGSIMAGEIDPFLTLVTYLQVIAIFHFLQKEKWLTLFILSYLLTAIGFMTKGLPSVLVQAITLLSFLIYAKKWKLLFSWQHTGGIVLFLILVGSYFLTYELAGGDTILFLLNLVKESSEKSFVQVSFLSIAFHLLEFPLTLIQLLLPWSLIALIVVILKRKNVFATSPPYLVKYYTLFVIGNIIIYWISPGSRNVYLYIFFPFLCLIIAYYIIRASKDFIPKLRYLLLALIIIRYAYSLFIMPYQQKELGYGHHIEKTLDIIGDNNLTYYNESHDFELSLNLFQLVNLHRSVIEPAHIKYVIPYFYQKQTGKILTYSHQAEKNKYYLTVDSYLSTIDDYDVLYEFKNSNNEIEYVLVYVRGEE